MALQVSITHTTGDAYATAYARIDSLGLRLRDKEVLFQVGIYKTAANAGNPDREPFTVRTYSYDGSAYTSYIQAIQGGANPLAAGYTLLKTHTDFSAATDV